MTMLQDYLRTEAMTGRTLTPGALGELAAHAIRTNRVLLCIAAAFTVATYLTSLAVGLPFKSDTIKLLSTAATVLVPVFLLFMMGWHFLRMAIFIRPRRPTRRFLSDTRYYVFDPERLAVGLVAFLATSLVLGCFGYMKDLIPVLHPFSWDPAFAEWDRWLHGGRDAYEYLLPLFGGPQATTALNAVYHFWFFLLFFVVYMVCLDSANPVRRNSFLISFALIWVMGGVVMATAFSSVGPVYYDAFGYGTDYLPLTDLLYRNAETSPVWALGVHEMLLENYHDGTGARGISAMPSMHVTSSVLLAIHGFAWRRWAGWLLTLFAILIQLGSVHLAWHYAIDGYVGAAVAGLCWLAGRALARRFA